MAVKEAAAENQCQSEAKHDKTRWLLAGRKGSSNGAFAAGRCIVWGQVVNFWDSVKRCVSVTVFICYHLMFLIMYTPHWPSVMIAAWELSSRSTSIPVELPDAWAVWYSISWAGFRAKIWISCMKWKLFRLPWGFRDSQSSETSKQWLRIEVRLWPRLRSISFYPTDSWGRPLKWVKWNQLIQLSTHNYFALAWHKYLLSIFSKSRWCGYPMPYCLRHSDL